MKRALVLLFLVAGAAVAWWAWRIKGPWRSSGLQPTVSASKEAGDAACRRAFDEIMGREPVLIRVVFGYKDSRPTRFVGDRYERNALVRELIAPCPPGAVACGFRRAADDGETFTKEIGLRSGGRRQVVVEILHSSAGPDDDENRKDPLQAWRSRRAETVFLEGMREARVVLYDGHSRDGGGPDFGPPRLVKEHVDYYWYQLKRPGLERLLARLRETPRAPKLLGLFSCVSSRHFSAELREAAPSLALVTSSELLYYIDAFKGLLGTVGAVLGQACPTDFKQSIGASQLENFFETD